jgi:predicted GIY-YIG superfamily endonuclease
MKIKLAGIYKIEHKSGYYYIGKSVDLFGRWASHATQLTLKTHHSPKFQELWNSSDPSEWTFSILERVSKTEVKKSVNLKGKEFELFFRKVLGEYEKEWMRKYSINFALNSDNKHFS